MPDPSSLQPRPVGQLLHTPTVTVRAELIRPPCGGVGNERENHVLGHWLHYNTTASSQALERSISSWCCVVMCVCASVCVRACARSSVMHKKDGIPCIRRCYILILTYSMPLKKELVIALVSVQKEYL